MNFYLDNGAAEFELDSSSLKFYPNTRAIDFVLNGTQEVDEDGWILTTGFWDDSEFWDDEEYWKDSP
jgi:hypothetical protein